MFEQTFVGGKTKTTWTMMLAMLGQVVLVVIAVIIPMIYFDVLPSTSLTSYLVAPPPPPPPPPPPAAAPPVKVVKVIPRQFDMGKLTAPKAIPKEVATIKEDELPPPVSGVAGVPGGVPGGVAGGVGGGVLSGIMNSVPAAAPPPPPPPKVEKKEIQRQRIGGNVIAASLIRAPKPVYPQLAKQARIQGIVKLSAIISTTGTVQNLEVISGHPLLVPAALEAVKQWVYKPTMLNGDPVEVITTIDVNFTLSQ
jgi:protein TonB